MKEDGPSTPADFKDLASMIAAETKEEDDGPYEELHARSHQNVQQQ